MIAAGELNQRVTIEKPTVASGAYGMTVGDGDYETVTTRYASVKPVRAKEVIRADQPNMETAYVVKMRYTDLVQPDYRITWKGRQLYIDSIVNVDSSNRELEILCNERKELTVE